MQGLRGMPEVGVVVMAVRTTRLRPGGSVVGALQKSQAGTRDIGCVSTFRAGSTSSRQPRRLERPIPGSDRRFGVRAMGRAAPRGASPPDARPEAWNDTHDARERLEAAPAVARAPWCGCVAAPGAGLALPAEVIVHADMAADFSKRC